jgi:hypothetical protein
MNVDRKAEILHMLNSGELEIEGLLPWSSNYAFLGQICSAAGDLPIVYKPRRGERPLWDFPQGTLCVREQAAFLLSDALGWDIVPPTVLRQGQHGYGTVQLFIDHDPERHYFTFEGQPRFAKQVQQMVLFDVVINNADRKSGHVLIEKEVDEGTSDGETAVAVDPGNLWGIDHGISFHTDFKLRTVIWEFAGLPIPKQMLNDLKQLQKRLKQRIDEKFNTELHQLLSAREIQALIRRLELICQQAVFPSPGPGRHYPWPPV